MKIALNLVAIAALFLCGGCGHFFAQSNDVGPVSAVGAAVEEGGACGGIAGFECADGLYCQFEPGTCGAADQMGVCQPRPEICTQDYLPVCGCNGKTYGNACGAASAGVSVVHPGICEE